MAERTNTFQSDSQRLNLDNAINEAASRVKADVSNLVEGFDLQAIANRVEEFGKQNPLGLAVSALTLGVAFGFLMKGTRRNPMH